MNLDNEFYDNNYNKYLIDKAEIKRIPMIGSIELTPICNMKCNMCYIQHDSNKIYQNSGLKSIDFWEKIIDQSIEQGMLFCLLTGGEIFTYPNFRELYERIIKKPIYIVLNTNATLLNEETVKWLAKNPPRRLNISLYGSSTDTYDILCHYPQGYNKILEAFQLLNKYNIQYRVHGVLVPSNIKDYEGIVKICNQFNTKLEMSNYMFPPLRKQQGHIDNYERLCPKDMAEIALKYTKDSCINNKMWENFIKDKVKEVTHYKDSLIYGVDKILCKNGICSFWINWKGEMSGCGVSDENVYDLNKYSFQYAWEEIKKYVNNVRLSQKCATCKYKIICPTCLASAVCETGRVDGTPEYLCEYCEEYYKLILEEYERLSKDE